MGGPMGEEVRRSLRGGKKWNRSQGKLRQGGPPARKRLRMGRGGAG